MNADKANCSCPRSSAFIGGQFSSVLLIIEPVSQYRLHEQVIRRLRHSHPDAEVEFPILSEVDIHRRQYLLLLIPNRVEAGNRTAGAVILQAERHLFRHVIAELHVGRKHKSLARPRTVKRPIQGRVKRRIELADLLVHDGAQFHRPGVGREHRALIPDLDGHAQPDRPFIALRYGDSRADVRAHPLPTSVGLQAGELVEPRLRPLVPPMGDFQRLVQGVIGGQHAIHHPLRPPGGEVAMQFRHRASLGNEVRAVDLHFVVALSVRTRDADKADDDYPEMTQEHFPLPGGFGALLTVNHSRSSQRKPGADAGPAGPVVRTRRHQLVMEPSGRKYVCARAVTGCVISVTSLRGFKSSSTPSPGRSFAYSLPLLKSSHAGRCGMVRPEYVYSTSSGPENVPSEWISAAVATGRLGSAS